jgi:uncharacterized protein
VSERAIGLITGASAGLGATFARALAKRGIDLMLVARRTERLQELARSLQQEFSCRCEVITADLATDDGIVAVREKIAATPTLRWLINNAGYATKQRFYATELAEQDRMHRLHVLAPLHLTHAALAHMVPADEGFIINVASVAGFFLSVGGVSYAATKSWLHVFTSGIDVELQSTGSRVRVQSLCPGYTVTEFHDVLGMDRRLIPKFLWLDADFVVSESLRAIDKGQGLVVPGWAYKLLVSVSRVIPAGLIRRSAIRVGRRTGRE